MARTARPKYERFLEKVLITDTCWFWQGNVGAHGYGTFFTSSDKPCQRAHRISYELFLGDIPNGLYVCHKCDNTICVRPMHLFIGTAKDNTHDMINKGRAIYPLGESSGRPKLTEQQVLEIRNLKQTTNLSIRAIGRMFHVTHENIRAIISRRTWSHI